MRRRSFTGLRVEEAGGPVVAGSCYPSTIRAEGHPVNPTFVSKLLTGTGGYLKYLRQPSAARAAAGGGDPAAILTERYRVDWPWMAQGLTFLQGLHPDDPRRPVTASRAQPFPVWAERYCPDRAIVS